MANLSKYMVLKQLSKVSVVSTQISKLYSTFFFFVLLDCFVTAKMK